VLKISSWRFLESFRKKDMDAWYDFVEKNPNTPFTGGQALPWDATGMSELTKLEARYFQKKRR
jgi:hypothetical protein